MRMELADEALTSLLGEAETRLKEKQHALEAALHSLEEARRELLAAREEVHALREALAHWLLSRTEAEEEGEVFSAPDA